MKKLLLISLLLSGFMGGLMAQSIVGTDPENKNVVLEEFTGLNCGYCPDGHAIAQGIYDQNPNDVVLVNVHVGAFAAPSAGQPDYRTPWGGALDAQAAVAGYPAGTVNRHLFPGWGQSGGTAMSRNYWVNASNQMMAQPSYLNVGCEATIITSTRQLVVNVEVYYTGDSPNSSNFLTVALMQSNIIGYQASGGSNYNHKHMLRHFLTGQWGYEITETTEGSLYSASLYYEVPEDYLDVECVLEDLEIAAYVAEGHQEIISGSMGEITYVDALELDAGIVGFNVPQTSCGDDMTAQVTIKNFGTQELTSLDFEYTVNDEDTQTYNWTGNLAQGETTTVDLPTFAIDAEQSNMFYLNTLNPNNEDDQLTANNDFSTSFERTAFLPQSCKVAILTDQNPEETTWDIKNSSGDIIASGGPYTITSIFIEPFEWTGNDCYTFTIYDAGGNGMDGGFYKIVNSGTQLIWEGNPDFGYETSAQFAYDELMDVNTLPLTDDINVYPNPILESAQVEFTLLQQSTVQMGIYNLLGKRVIHIIDGQIMPAGPLNYPINTDALESGVYLLKLEVNGQVYSKKINVAK